MKKILLLIFSFIFFNAFAQLDREHWFAPMYDGQSNASGYEQFLHLSTNEKTPFTVKVYNNNIVIAQRTISKGNPAVIDIARNYIITRDASALLKVGTRGLYVKADRPCFANLRFGVTNHAEIITSKGTAGIGTKFYTVVAPNVQNSNNLGFAASFLATEDNTNVTVNNFKKTISFTNGANAKSISFTLNKGQSYIIDGRSFNGDQQDGFIGATVTSDKPISMSNGNFNGQYATTDSGEGSDILMDQSVPVDKLGNEFVIVKGYGEIGNNMEGAILVATEKNTAFYLNDSTVPFATLANEGDHYVINESNYIDRSNGHYNLHIRTDKNVYVYQLLGGVAFGGSVLATGGMNYIPPLNCYLPRTIDEISYINKINENDSDTRFVTKLNIITEKGAVVKVNGVIPNSVDGPYDISTITANQTWVTYSIPNVKGNITVESTKAVTAGIASGNAAFGYGGYFAGFSSIPLILKTEGDCLPGVKLEVTKGFDSYKWYNRDDPTTILSTDYFFSPPAAGIYYVKVQQGTCAEIHTKDFKFYNCTTYTNYDYDICTEKMITPKFALSTQNVKVSTITVDTPATKGTITINKTDPTDLLTYGKVIYKAYPNAKGTDTFKYSFCGEGALPDCETVQATIHLNQIEKYDVVLKECSATATANFNLTLAAITPDATVAKKYFKDATYLVEIPVGQLAQYNSAPGFVYVQMSNAFGCTETAIIELKIIVPPVVTPALYTIKHCDEDIDGVLDGTFKVILTSITPLVVQNATAFTVKYYEDEAKAIAGIINTDIKGTFSFTGNRSIWIRVDSPEVCAPVIKEILLRTGTKLTIASPINKDVCDNNLDNTENINLDTYLTDFLTNPYDSVKYFDDLIKAQNDLPGQNILAPQTITGNKTFYFRFKKDGVCDALGTLNIILKKSTPTALKDSYSVCEGGSITLIAEPSPTYKAWSWIKAGVNFSPTNTAILSAGVYTVSFTNSSDCVFTKTITIKDSPKAVFTLDRYNATLCDDNFDGSIEVKFSRITPFIVQKYALYTIRYYTSQAFADAGGSNNLPDDWSFTSNTKIYVRVDSPACPYITGIIDFKFGNNLPLLTYDDTITICDDDLDGIKTLNLLDYYKGFYNSSPFSLGFYATLQDAQLNSNGLDANLPVDINNTRTFYLRIGKKDFCASIAKLTLKIKIPTKSNNLEDQQICPEKTATLDAGAGFTDYLWSTGAKTESIKNVPVGDYWVDLTYDGCTYRQNVSVTAVELPKITNVDIQGTTITVTVTGGKKPYQYSLDGINYQAANIFTNVSPGEQTIYVISADQCAPVTAKVYIIRILNVITPNDDGMNDLLDYSDLLKKEEPFLQIFDRNGNIVFKGDQSNRFIWNGKNADKTVSSSSYWYVLQWREIGAATVTKLTGWVLVKNRQ